jgi:hypothetical protein
VALEAIFLQFDHPKSLVVHTYIDLTNMYYTWLCGHVVNEIQLRPDPRSWLDFVPDSFTFFQQVVC